MVIDGNSIINRSFYGIRPLTTREGLYTNAVYGFVVTLQRLLDQGVTVYGTGQSGTILLTSDGYNCTFSTSLTLSLEHVGNQ